MFIIHQRELLLVACSFFAASAVAHGEAPANEAAKPRATFTAFTPHYLCLCAPYCRKPAPATPCFCVDCTCDIYCRKPLPAPLCGPCGVCRDPGVCPLQIP